MMLNDLPNVKGLASLRADLDGVTADVRKLVLRKMASAGARYVRDRVKEKTPVAARGRAPTPGQLQRAAFYYYSRKQSDPSRATFVVTYRAKTGFYAGWVNNGHRIVPRKSKLGPRALAKRRRASTGRVSGLDFFDGAVAAAASTAAQTMVDVGSTELARIIAARKLG